MKQTNLEQNNMQFDRVSYYDIQSLGKGWVWIQTYYFDKNRYDSLIEWNKDWLKKYKFGGSRVKTKKTWCNRVNENVKYFGEFKELFSTLLERKVYY